MKLPVLTPDFITDPLEKLVGQLEKAVGPETTQSKLISLGWVDERGREMSWKHWQQSLGKARS